jgi:hypothetical protein
MFKGGFITAYLQREIPMDVAVVGGTPLRVGQLVTLTPSDGVKPAYIAAAAGDEASDVLAAATHIVAQSDVSMGQSHVPVENRDWKYVDTVAVTVAAAGSVTATTATKHVALYAITDKNDIIVTEV